MDVHARPCPPDITPEEVEVLEPEVPEEWIEPEPEEVGEYHSNRASRDLRPLIMQSNLDEDCESEARGRSISRPFTLTRRAGRVCGTV